MLSIEYAAAHCTPLRHLATHCNIRMFRGVSVAKCARYNAMQHTAILCNDTLQYAVTYLSSNGRKTLRHTATCYITLHRTASHCIALQHTATHCNTMHHVGTHCSTLQHTATHCYTLQQTVSHCNTLQHTVPHCTTLRHTATHCNILQHTALHLNSNEWLLMMMCATKYTATNYEAEQDIPQPCTLQHITTHCNTLQHTATYCNIPKFKRVSVEDWARPSERSLTPALPIWLHARSKVCNLPIPVLQCVAVRCSALQCVAVCSSTNMITRKI